MNKINTFYLEGFDIDILFNNGFLGYTFTYRDKPYGNKIKVKSRSVIDITSATFLLIENAISTMKDLKSKE